MFCDECTKVKLGDGEAYIKPLLCRTWQCDECGPRRAAALRWQARAGAPNTFITLTVAITAYATPELAASALVAAWRLIRRRAMQEAKRDPRRRPKPFGSYAPAHNPNGPFGNATRRVELSSDKLEFMAFFERTEAGWPHLHILARSKWVDQKWLSAQCAELLSSPIVDVRRIKSSRGVARYVTKYVTKALARFAKLKRYYSSRGYAKRKKPEQLPEPLPDLEWAHVTNGYRNVLAHLVARFREEPRPYGPWWQIVAGSGPP